MLKRYSFNKNTDGYKNYGAKGIVLCKRWETFKYFLEDVGPKPGSREVYLRRKNKKLSFEPGNCVWDKRMSSPEGHQLTYKSYKSMLTRCYCETSTSYSAYGAKGVEVCDRWQASFWNFLEDMGPRPSKNFVLSRNGDTGNYEPENTTWKTREENESERQSARGERQGLSKLKEKDILTIRDLYKSGQTFTEIAKRYKVARSTVARIIEGKTWTHVF